MPDASVSELFPGHGIRVGEMVNDSKPRSELVTSQKSENLHRRLPGAGNMPCVLETRKIATKDPSMLELNVSRPRSAPDMGTGSGVVQHVDGKLMIRQMHASRKKFVPDAHDVALLRQASLGRAAKIDSWDVRAEDARNAASGREHYVSHHLISSPQDEVMRHPLVETHHCIIRDGVKGQKMPADMQDEALLPIVCNRLFGPAGPAPIDDV